MDVSSLQRNHLLSLLKPEVQQRLLPLLTLVSIDIGEILAEADRITSTVYFPLSLAASSLRTTEDGVTVEMITVGNEGFVGGTAGGSPAQPDRPEDDGTGSTA